MDIVLDFGVVVFRWEPAELIQTACPELALSTEDARLAAAEIFQGHQPEADWSEFDRGRLGLEEVCAQIARRTGWDPERLSRILRAVPQHLRPKPESVALIHALAEQQHRLFYLSNMPAPYADHIERTYPFLSLFVGGIYSARLGWMKPEPQIYAALDTLRSSDAQPIFVDDSMANVIAARTHGWVAVHYQSASQVLADLRALGALGAIPN